MAIIECPQCGKEISDKAPNCIYCGNVFIKENENKCIECGTILTETDAVCPNCGCPSKYELKEEKPQSVQVDKINVTSKMKKIIIGIIVAIIVCIGGGFGYKSYSDYKAEQEYIAHYNGYIDNLTNAKSLMISGGSDAESLCNLTQEVWSNAIFKKSDSKTDKYTKRKNGFVNDFNKALVSLYIDPDTLSTISKIKSNQSDVKTVMKKLQNPPDGLEKCYDTICELNTSYNVLTDMAISPSGNYTSFSSNKNNTVSDFESSYNKLDTQIPEKITSTN